MASIIKVDTIQDQDGNNIINESAGTITIGKSGDTVQVASGAEFVGGGIQWQSTIVTGTTLSAVAGNGYWIDTTSNACTVTLPGSASVGDTIEFSDYARTWNTNNVTINQNSLNFQGYTSPNPVYDVNGQSVRIVYSGATQGWIPTSDDNVTDEVPQAVTLDYLVIAGGGGGGDDQGGGGGAGGYRNSYSTEDSGGGASTETGFQVTSTGTVFTVTVGAGGAGATSASGETGDGTTSSISASGYTTVSCVGGGGGGSAANNANDGGSGGGASADTTSAGSGTANQGFDGASSGSAIAGGGGGAGSAGGLSAQGVGLNSSITGSSIGRAGGGAGFGGGTASFGGGDSATSDAGGDATANTGGGGGGGSGSGSRDGGNGASGVVILRVATADYSGTTTGSPTVTTDGTDTVMVFTGSGSYTA
jgi:hypothetical protein